MKIKRKIFFFQVKTYETKDKVSVQVWTDSTELQINNSVCEWENKKYSFDCHKCIRACNGLAFFF